MSCNRRNLDGTISVRRTIEFYDIIPEFEYEVCEAIHLLSDTEKEKLKKYIIRLTNGRANFSKKRKGSIKALQKIDENCREIYEL